jgi:hypothetical protein
LAIDVFTRAELLAEQSGKHLQLRRVDLLINLKSAFERFCMRFLRSSSIPWTLALSGFFVGCSDGPELGVVTGKVLQQGKPIPFAYVEFQPIDPPGTYGAAYTQVDGTFNIRFTEDKDGALVGKHKVTVRTAAVDEIQVEDKTTGLMVTPELPEGYQPKLSLEYSREVKPGTNDIVFDLAEGTPASSG